MRPLCFLLAFAFALVGPSMAGWPDRSLPNVGTFSYNGSPIAPPAPHAVVVAVR
jgi:hypothetical protein